MFPFVSLGEKKRIGEQAHGAGAEYTTMEWYAAVTSKPVLYVSSVTPAEKAITTDTFEGKCTNNY